MRIDKTAAPPRPATPAQPRPSFHALLAREPATKPSVPGSRTPPGPASRSSRRAPDAVPARPSPGSPSKPGTPAAPSPQALAATRLQRTLRDGRVVQAAADTREVLGRAHAASAKASREAEASRLRGSLERDLQRDAEQPLSIDSQRPVIEPAPAKAGATAPLPTTEATAAAVAPSEASAAGPAAPAARAEAIAALVERIERSMKAGRPELALLLGAGAAAENVTIVRTGPREVAVNVEARASRREQLREHLDDLGAALATRGLKLRLLRIRRG